MRKTTLILAVVLLTGCAAPPPVKIASHLIGRGLLKKAGDETGASGTTQTTPQQ